MMTAFEAMVEYIEAAMDVDPPPGESEPFGSFMARAGPLHRVHTLGARACHCRACERFSFLRQVKLTFGPPGLVCPHCDAEDEIHLVAEWPA